MDEPVLYELRDGVAHITLNRPDVANAINGDVCNSLLTIASSIERDSAVRAILLSGAGKRFCGGGDVVSSSGTGEPFTMVVRQMLAVFHNAVAVLARGNAPIVAAVQGAAAGAGMALVGLSDIAVAGESTKFVMAYTKVGLSPDGSSTWYLPRIVGLKRALELTLTNRTLTAKEALDYGLVTKVVPDAEVHDEALAIATQLASGPTTAFGVARRLLHSSLDNTLETHLAREADGFVVSINTADAREGTSAFAKKRTPNFTGQ